MFTNTKPGFCFSIQFKKELSNLLCDLRIFIDQKKKLTAERVGS